MRILGIETSAAHSSVALFEDGTVQAERYFPAKMSLGMTLPGHIRAVLETGSGEGADPEGIAVSLGPGSFTGLRVGVATAKAMAHGLNVPLVGVNTHEAVAWSLRYCGHRNICVIGRASRDHVHSTVFEIEAEANGRELVQRTRTAATTPGDLIPHLRGCQGDILIAGVGAEQYAETFEAELGERVVFLPGILAMPRAGIIAAIAEPRFACADPNAYLSLQPIYALASQAERAAGIDLGLDGATSPQ